MQFRLTLRGDQLAVLFLALRAALGMLGNGRGEPGWSREHEERLQAVLRLERRVARGLRRKLAGMQGGG